MSEFSSYSAEISARHDLALELSVVAGDILIEMQKAPEIRQKQDRTYVTNVDIKINQLFIDEIRKNFPLDAVIGEEEAYIPSDEGNYRWFIDPIDGTSDYIRGGKSNGIATALVSEEQIVFGSFYNPSLNELFTAKRGAGALLNNMPIHVNGVAYESGISYDYCYWRGASIDTRVFEAAIGRSREEYSISNQACRVAQGVSAFTVFPGKLPHDILPGAIIVQEAGGNVTNLQNELLDVTSLVHHGAIYSNGIVHESVFRELQ